MTEAAQGALSRDSKSGYRPALDGIRAIAVLAVIAYHFNYGWAPGGFLGVDVFFVLSGYLITSLLLGEYARTGRIALRDFWLRRARRLLPALFVLLVVVAIWVGLDEAPIARSLRRDDLLWTLFYASNWHFIQVGQDYFAQYASASPLRHTWSLAIEEQFYVVWPLLVAGTLWIGRKRPGVLAAACVVGIVVSGLAMALLFNPADPSRAYFGTEARMHQLLIGALLAVLVRQKELPARFRRAAGVVAPIAAVMLLVAFDRLHDQDPAYYRGVSVLLALTTAALVWAIEINPRTRIARALSVRPVAWVGQISYGLYLWHWPVILAITVPPALLANLPGATTGLNLTRLVVTFGLTIASFYLVEQPIRRGRVPVIGRSARRFAVAAAVCIVAVSGFTILATVDPPPGQRQASIPNCPPFTICVRHQGPAGAPVLAVVGDSVARSLDPAFLALAVQHDWTYVLQADEGCRVGHLQAIGVGSPAKLPVCYAKTQPKQDELRATWHPTMVVIADFMETVDVLSPEGRRIAQGSDEAISMSEQALADVVTRMTGSGAQVALLRLPPTMPKECLRASNYLAPACTFTFLGYPTGSSRAKYDEMFQRLAAATPGVHTLSITPAVCPGRVCSPIVNGIALRGDGIHFTADGARMLTPTLDAQLNAIGGLR